MQGYQNRHLSKRRQNDNKNNPKKHDQKNKYKL